MINAINEIYYQGVVTIFIYLNTRTRKHPVDSDDTSFNTIGEHALAVAPYRVGCIGRTDLTSSETRMINYLMGGNLK